MTLNMIQAVNSLKFVDSCRSLSTGGQKLWNDHKIDESSRHMNGKITCQILYEDLGKRKMCMKFVPHSFTGTKEHGHNPWRRHLDLSYQHTLSQLYWYCRRILNAFNTSRIRSSKHKWKTKFSSTRDKYCMQKSRIWTILITSLINGVWYTTNQCWRKNSDQWILCTVAGKVIEISLKDEATVLR